MIAVRPATADDVPFLVATQRAPHARGFVFSATPEQVRDALARTDRATYVIVEDGEPVGMMLFGSIPRRRGSSTCGVSS